MNQNGSSVFEYIMMSTCMFKLIHSSAVMAFDASCHFPLCCTFKCKQCSGLLSGLHCCKWNDENSALFVEYLGLEHVGQTVEGMTNMCVIWENVNTIVAGFNSLIYDDGKHTLHKCGGKGSQIGV